MPFATHRAVAVLAAAALGMAGCAGDDLAGATPGTVASETVTPETVPLATVPAPFDSVALGAQATTPSIVTEPVDPDGARTPLASPPRQVVIPAIDVDASIIDLGLTDDGALETPTNFDLAGWWAGGTVADEAGPTVIVGHVDDQDGPAVFFRLQELELGDSIIVIDALGRESSFTVVDKALYDKASFPTDRVYGASDSATLRLVTCGGEFDRSERSYESNWVVYAVS